MLPHASRMSYYIFIIDYEGDSHFMSASALITYESTCELIFVCMLHTQAFFPFIIAYGYT